MDTTEGAPRALRTVWQIRPGLFWGVTVPSLLFLFMCGLCLFDEIPFGGNRTLGTDIRHGALYADIEEKNPGTFSHSIAPFYEHSLVGFGYCYWRLGTGDWSAPVVVGWIAQIYVPFWFILPLWALCLLLASHKLYQSRRRGAGGFEVIQRDQDPPAN